MLVDATNSNNHAGIERQENSEKAEALLKIINDYRVYVNRFAQLPTWDVLQFLSKLQAELFERYNKELYDLERDKVKNEYYYLTGKKPFLWWTTDEIRQRIEEFKSDWQVETESALKSKKSRWKKAMQK